MIETLMPHRQHILYYGTFITRSINNQTRSQCSSDSLLFHLAIVFKKFCPLSSLLSVTGLFSPLRTYFPRAKTVTLSESSQKYLNLNTFRIPRSHPSQYHLST